MRGFVRAGSWVLALAVLVGCGQATDGVEKLSTELAANTTGPCLFANGGTGVGGGPDPSVLTFQEGLSLGGSQAYSGTTDTTLEQAVPDTNEGAVDYLILKGGANKRHGLIRWELSSLPTSMVVQDACIALRMQDPSGAAYPAYEVLRPWSESQATWNVAATGTAWGSPGAWGAADSGSTTVAAIPGNARGQVFFALSKELVQRWVSHPEQNHGVVFGNNSSYDGTSFVSSEGPATMGPALLIKK